MRDEKIKPLKQDQHFFKKKPTQVKVETPVHNKTFEDILSDDYYPQLPDDKPMRYCRDDQNPYILKQLRRGDFAPECFIDLHGMRKSEAKIEIIRGI